MNKLIHTSPIHVLIAGKSCSNELVESLRLSKPPSASVIVIISTGVPYVDNMPIKSIDHLLAFYNILFIYVPVF